MTQEMKGRRWIRGFSGQEQDMNELAHLGMGTIFLLNFSTGSTVRQIPISHSDISWSIEYVHSSHVKYRKTFHSLSALTMSHHIHTN